MAAEPRPSPNLMLPSCFWKRRKKGAIKSATTSRGPDRTSTPSPPPCPRGSFPAFGGQLHPRDASPLSALQRNVQILTYRWEKNQQFPKFGARWPMTPESVFNLFPESRILNLESPVTDVTPINQRYNELRFRFIAPRAVRAWNGYPVTLARNASWVGWSQDSPKMLFCVLRLRTAYFEYLRLIVRYGDRVCCCCVVYSALKPEKLTF